MKILLATDTYFPHVNGAAYFTRRLAYCLRARGHTVAVIAPSVSFKNTRDNVGGVSIYGVWSLPVFFYRKFRFSLPPIFIRRRIRTIIDEFNPDIAHLQGHFFISRTVLEEAKAKRIPVIATNHFMPENLVHYLHLPESVTNLIIKWAWHDFAGVFNKADYVTTPTKTAASLIQHRLRSPVQAISCGIDIKRFNPNNDGEHLYERYRIPRRPILLYVGRLDREKNLDLALRAVAKASSDVDFHFVIAGNGTERTVLENLAKKLSIASAVTFAGFVPDEDLANLYAIAQCFIIAGTVELQSIVTMEAMASGLPILAADALALPELVHDGDNGFLFKNEDALAGKIKIIFSDQNLRKRLAEKSLEFIAAHDIDNVISSFEKLYRTALSQK